MAARLSKRRSGDHAHQPLLSGRAKDAAFYPLKLVTEILRGVRDTAEAEHPDEDRIDREMARAMPELGTCTTFLPRLPPMVGTQDRDSRGNKWSTTVRRHDGSTRVVHLADRFRHYVP